MGYYDNVKDSVKENSSSSGGGFDTLKESAEKNSTPDEEKGDDTPIEVVDEGLRKEPVEDESSSQNIQSSEDSDSNENPFTSDSSSNADMEGVEQRLDKIIEQNEKMIKILESFGS